MSEQDAPRRLSDHETQQFVLETVAANAASLLRTAERHSLCADDAHDAYQRAMEIFMRRAPTLERAHAARWLQVVVKHEAMEIRRGRTQHVGAEDVDYESHVAPDAADPEDRVLSTDRSARAAEALRRLKPQELRAIWLKALGHSYVDELGHEDQAGSAATLALTYAPAAAPTPTPTPTPLTDPTPLADPGPLPEAGPLVTPTPTPTPTAHAKSPANLKLTTLQRLGRRLTVAGALAPATSGHVTVRYRVRVGARTLTFTKRAAIRRGRYHLSTTLSPAFSRATKAIVSVSYGGDPDTLAAARTAVWRLQRQRN